MNKRGRKKEYNESPWFDRLILPGNIVTRNRNAQRNRVVAGTLNSMFLILINIFSLFYIEFESMLWKFVLHTHLAIDDFVNVTNVHSPHPRRCNFQLGIKKVNHSIISLVLTQDRWLALYIFKIQATENVRRNQAKERNEERTERAHAREHSRQVARIIWKLSDLPRQLPALRIKYSRTLVVRLYMMAPLIYTPHL